MLTNEGAASLKNAAPSSTLVAITVSLRKEPRLLPARLFSVPLYQALVTITEICRPAMVFRISQVHGLPPPVLMR